MNLVAFLNRGARLAPPPEHAQCVVRAAEKARRQWLNALLVDQTRALLDLGEKQPEVLRGMSAMLALAAWVQAHDLGTEDTPEQRVIRGAMSAAAQCAEAGCVVSTADAQAFSVAASRAVEIIRSGTVSAIIHAAQRARAAVGLA
jgi:hypothetical protein